MNTIQDKLADLREQFGKADYYVRGYVADTQCGVGVETTCEDFKAMQRELTSLLNMVVAIKVDLRLSHADWYSEVDIERQYGK